MPKTGLYVATAGGFAIGLIASRYLNKSTARLRNGAESSKKFLPILAENRPRTYYAWRGPSMIVLDAQGEAGSLEDSGFFFRQTRYLRELRLELFGESPHFCSIAEIAPNEMEFAYIYPEKKGGGSDRGGERHGIHYRDLDIRLICRVRANGVMVTLRITNRWIEQTIANIGWRLSADFADYGEVFGDCKQEAAIRTETDENEVRFQYQHPELPLETIIRLDGPGNWTFSQGRMSADIEMPRQTPIEIKLDIQAVDRADPINDEEANARDIRLAAWQDRITTIDTGDDSEIAAAVNGSMRDIGSLALLEGSENEWLTPAAGIPLYQSLWGRDALTTAWHATVFDRGQLAESILSTLSRLQGTHDDLWRDEQPRRITRGRQRSPLTRLNVNSMGLYYGDYASPFAFIFTLAQLYAWSGERRYLEKHFDSARRILDWAQNDGDIDGDGYLEYKTRSADGPKHQGWRDAHNAIVYPDGTQVETPIATCEIQGYWFAAQQIMAVASAVLGKPGDAVAYWNNASDLKRRFNHDFWMSDENCIALGLDPF